MKASIIDYDHQGRGIAKIDNKVVFIPNAIIGEEVEITITKSKKNFMEGKVIKYLHESPNRISNVCPYYLKCGGCDILHLSYDKQLEFKENKIKNIINRYLKKDIKINNIVSSDSQFNYRNKVTFQVKNNICGFFDKGSSNIVKIDKCLLINDKLNQMIPKLNKKYGNKIVLRTNGDTVIDKYNEKIICSIGNFKYYVSLASFFQVNSNVTKKLYDKVLSYIDNNDKTILDLYCGTGTIGIYLANKCKKIIGIEINEQAVLDANANKKLNNTNNIEFICGDTKNLLKEIKIKPDVIVVDPPRNGLETDTINQIIELNANKIIYVSCDPMTLTRDLNILNDKYNIIEITPFDMFPNTYHVECVCVLKLR